MTMTVGRIASSTGGKIASSAAAGRIHASHGTERGMPVAAHPPSFVAVHGTVYGTEDGVPIVPYPVEGGVSPAVEFLEGSDGRTSLRRSICIHNQRIVHLFGSICTSIWVAIILESVVGAAACEICCHWTDGGMSFGTLLDCFRKSQRRILPEFWIRIDGNDSFRFVTEDRLQVIKFGACSESRLAFPPQRPATLLIGINGPFADFSNAFQRVILMTLHDPAVSFALRHGFQMQ